MTHGIPARSRPIGQVPIVGVWPGHGVVAGCLYVTATVAVLLAMPAQEIGAVQGIL